MTIKQLWECWIPGVKSNPTVSFDVASGQDIAIDFNCWLHGSCSQPLNALCIVNDPPYPPTDIVKTIELWHAKMLEKNITPYYVFDGRKHPMKLNTHNDRQKMKCEALTDLNLFCQRGKDASIELSDGDHAVAMKNVKIISGPNVHVQSLITK